MRVLILGTARSGTTAVYRLLQNIMRQSLGSDVVDYVYEPFLWDRDVFNGDYDAYGNKFSYVDSISVEGVYQHQTLPLFIREDNDDSYSDFVNHLLCAQNDKPHLLLKTIRSNGRLRLFANTGHSCKVIFTLRNPIDTINSLAARFSFYGGEFHRDDFPRFVKEVNSIFQQNYDWDGGQNEAMKLGWFWYYMNQFALKSLEELGLDVFFIANEQLNSNPGQVIRDLCGFLEVQFNETYVDHAGKRVAGQTGRLNLGSEDVQLLRSYLDTYKAMLEANRIPFPESLFSRLDKKYNLSNLPELSRFNNDYYGRTSLYLRGRIRNNRS